MDQKDFHLRPTRDHHPVPRSKGGRRTIICCLLCNNRKGDMTAAEWQAYMRATPEWWKLTKRQRKQIRAANREASRTEKWGPRDSRAIRHEETDMELYRGRPSRREESAVTGAKSVVGECDAGYYSANSTFIA